MGEQPEPPLSSVANAGGSNGRECGHLNAKVVETRLILVESESVPSGQMETNVIIPERFGRYLVGAAILFVFSSTVNAQCKDIVVGTWKLVSNTATTDKGDVNKAVLGKNPSGLLTYTADGRMMAIISDDGRKPLSIADRVAAPAEERAQAYSTFMAYAGRYTFTCDKVVHHIEVASLQNWVNTDQTRFVHIEGNRLFVRNTPQLRGGVMVTIESVWERLK
jgi:hypothetical protein